CFDLAIDQIAQSGLSSLKVIYYSAQLFRALPKEKHLTGKIFTQRIERNNLTLRTRIKWLARKTLCFSRSVELHEKVIGAFIEKHMFY
ncbi:IS1 family transposase, partial [Shigella sonnei]|uniref:IS1 family transposase n=1 Tax=Shigella sonnei TaxID=624 RepID=UPI0020942109